MVCSVRNITNSVVAEDKNKTERNVRKLLYTTDAERLAANANPLSFITKVIQKTKPTLDGKNVHLLDLKRSKEGVFTVKYKVGTSNKVITESLDNTSHFKNSGKDFSVSNESLNMLYSDYGTIFNTDGYEKLALNVTNSPERILDVANYLVEADEYHNDEQHNDALMHQLRSIVKPLMEMVPNMNVHINNAGEANYGTIDVDSNDIYISKGIGGSKSLLEIYVHELYHAVTHFAINSRNIEMRKYVSKMVKVREHFLENTSKQDLIRASGGSINMEQAGVLLDHMSNNGTGLHEFVALSMSNKAVMTQLKKLNVAEAKSTEKSLFYRLMNALTQVFNIINRVLGKEPAGNDFARMVYLVARIHETNKKPMKAKHHLALRNLISIFDPLERKFEDHVKRFERKVAEDLEGNLPKAGEGNFRYGTRMLYRSFFDQKARDYIGNAVSNASLLRPEGTIRSALRDMQENDDMQNAVESMVMSSQNIEQRREFTAIGIARSVRNASSRPLTEEEEIALSEVILDTDLSTVFHADYNIEELLSNKKNIDKAASDVLKKLNELTDKESVNYYDIQTDILANYMIHHDNHIALSKNAENIAKKVSTPREEVNVPKELIKLVDELATLKALKRTKPKYRKILKELIEEDPIAVETMVAYQYGMKYSSEEQLFKHRKEKFSMIKGYSVQLGDDEVEVTVAPKDEEASLKKQGYKLLKTLGKHEFDSNNKEMAMYVNNRMIVQTYNRVGLRVTARARRGMSITESYNASGNTFSLIKATADINNLKKRKGAVTEAMFKGTYKLEDNESDSMLSPVLNSFGAVKDFTYGMKKEEKIDLLNVDRKISNVLGRTVASIYDKKESESYNDRLMKLLDEDVEKNNKKGKRFSAINGKEYIRVGDKSDNAMVKEFWKIAPAKLKNDYPNGFMVRRDLMMMVLGFRDPSIVEVLGISRLSGNVTDKIVKQSIQFAEMLWKEVVKISKIDIVIRTPGVFIGNVVSNMLMMYVYGYSFKEITQLKMQGIQELNRFIKDYKESIELEFKVSANVASETEVRRLNAIKDNLANSPVKDLVDEGFYTTILEEMEHGEGTGSYFNKLAKRKLSKVPKILKDGVNMLYITENTKLFKLIEKGVQTSDFAARYAQYHLMLADGKSKEEAVVAIRDNFINYAKPNSRFLEWLNQMGFVMFTKYFTRIQRVITRYGKTDPIKMAGLILLQSLAIGELDTFDDQWFATKDLSNMTYNPLDHVFRVITPSSLELVDWTLNGPSR